MPRAGEGACFSVCAITACALGLDTGAKARGQKWLERQWHFIGQWSELTCLVEGHMAGSPANGGNATVSIQHSANEQT